MPVPVAQRHFSTGDFKINLREYFWVDFENQNQGPLPTVCNPSYQAIKTDWALYENGQIIAQKKGEHFGYFDGDWATYRLEVDVTADPVCVAALQPRLRVTTFNDYRELHGLIRLFAAVLVVAGVCIFIRSLVPYRRPWAEQQLGLDEFAASYPRPGWSQRLPLSRPFDVNPGFGLIAAITVLCVLIPAWLLNSTLMAPDYKGYYVLITAPKPNPVFEVKEEPVVVSARRNHGADRAALYVNSQTVEWADASKILRAELARRADRIVYIEGDDNLPYQDLAQVIDIAREAWPGVPVVLKTPGRDSTAPKAKP